MSNTGETSTQLSLGFESDRSFGDVFAIEGVSRSEASKLSEACPERSFLCRICDDERLRTRRGAGSGSADPSRRSIWRFRALCALPSDTSELHVPRALLESRIVARSLRARPGEVSVGDALRSLPFPEVEPGFAAQLVALRRRRETSADARSVDWAIERVVAELYECSLPELVRLQTEYRRQSAS